MPYRGGVYALPKLMLAVNIIGSDIKNFECPRCGAHDRERHLLLYMNAVGIFQQLPSMHVLHFAPESRLSKILGKSSPARYVQCDLHPEKPEVQRIDIESMPFADSEFDLVIANHVMEHVNDDYRAACEVARVLKVGGIAILQTPYSPILQATWSDPGLITPAARLQAYGQEDHVRLFGRDVFERLAVGGLRPYISTHSELLPEFDSGRYGVNALEPFFLFRREG